MPSSTLRASPASRTLAQGTEADYVALLSVHLGGYLNVLDAALPLMAEAGHGRILGVTSGSGWRAADAGGTAGQAGVAALTWHMAAAPPAYDQSIYPSPALAWSRPHSTTPVRRAGPVVVADLRSDPMPGPEDLGPSAPTSSGPRPAGATARCCSPEGPGWRWSTSLVSSRSSAPPAPCLCRGRPRAVTARDYPAESARRPTGGSNPRFGPSSKNHRPRPHRSARCGPAPSSATAPTRRGRHRRARGPRHRLPSHGARPRIRGCNGRVACRGRPAGPIDAVVTGWLVTTRAAPPGPAWQDALAGHQGITEGLHTDAAWAWAAADYATEADRPVRLVTLGDARSAAGRSRAQAAAQLARVAGAGTQGRLTASPWASKRRRSMRCTCAVHSSGTSWPRRRQPTWRGPSSRSAMDGSACAATPVRSAPSPTAVPPFLRGSMAPCGTSLPPPGHHHWSRHDQPAHPA